MSDGIVDTTEMYIKVIYELLEDGIVAMRARIVDRLQHLVLLFLKLLAV